MLLLRLTTLFLRDLLSAGKLMRRQRGQVVKSPVHIREVTRATRGRRVATTLAVVLALRKRLVGGKHRGGQGVGSSADTIVSHSAAGTGEVGGASVAVVALHG